MSAAKMDYSMRVRVDNELREKFANIHAKEGKNRDLSDTIRELMRAAIRYYDKHGNLYPPWDLTRS